MEDYKVTITVETSNECFQIDTEKQLRQALLYGVEMIGLRGLGRADGAAIIDVNGNTCGRVTVEQA